MAIATSFSVGAMALAGCNQQPGQPTSGSAPASTAPAPAGTSGQPQASAYTPPTADQLYQMVAPIALFPDKLVAQVLAGSTYPDQITAADTLLTQNPNLKGGLLQTDVDQQQWDPSVKGLTAFPSVLDQMSKNIQWTTQLGQVYVNDPTDVLNAIQVMRQRAQAQGNLRSSAQQQVTTAAVQPAVQSAEDSGTYADEGGSYPATYSGPAVVQAPAQVIEIEPAQPDTVYVPAYDPQTVYGGDIPVYPDYAYQPPPPAYTTGDVVAIGAVSFGVGILVGSLLDHHGGGGYGGGGGGWHSWGMNWGGGRGPGGPVGGPGGGFHRPAVVYNNQTYVSRSTTVINHYNTTNNINRTNNFNNRAVTNNINNGRNPAFENRAVANNVNRPAAAPASVPNFGAHPTSAARVQANAAAPAEHAAIARPAENAARPGVANAAARPGFANHVAPTQNRPVPATHPLPASRLVNPAGERAAAEAARAQPQARPQVQHAATPRPQTQARPAPQARPQAQARPEPQARPQQQARPEPQARPQQEARPQQHAAPAHAAPKKKDDHH